MDLSTILQQITDGVSSLWILGLIPCIPLLYMIAIAWSTWFKNGAESAREIRAWKRDSRTEFIFHMLNRVKKTYQHLTLVLVTILVLMILYRLYDKTGEMVCSNADTICNMILSLTIIALTVAVVVILLNKNYYLTFSIQEVLQNYHFTGSIACIIASSLTACSATYFILSYEAGERLTMALVLVLECSMIYNLFATISCLRAIYKIMFSSQRAELRLLNHLDRIFWSSDSFDDSDMRKGDEWSFSAMKPNVEYLTGSYVTAARKIPIQDVETLHGMIPGEESQSVWDRKAEKTRKRFVILDVIVYAAGVVICILALQRDSFGLILLNTASFVVSLILLTVKKSPVRRSFNTVISQMMGYSMNTTRRKGILISRYKIGYRNRYEKFVSSMNNLTAFFVIALRQGVDQGAFYAALTDMLDWLSDISRKDRNTVLYLPAFTIGFFAYVKGMLFPDLQSLCWELGRDDEEFSTMIRDQILYLTHASANEKDYTVQIENYLNWLREGADYQKMLPEDQAAAARKAEGDDIQ